MDNILPKKQTYQISGITFLIIFPLFLSLLIANTGFIFSIPIQKYYFLVSFLLSIFIYKIIVKPSNFILFKHIFFTCLLFILCFIVSGYFYDWSSDGQVYHQESIIMLKEGWNPIYETPPARVGDIWVKHYAKGIETIQTVLYKLTNKIEMGKAINILLVISSFLLCTLCLKKLKIGKYKTYIYSFLIACNPVCISQLFTFYIDGVFYSSVICIIASLVLILIDKHKIYYYILSGVVLIGISVKFTSIAIIAVILLLVLILLIIQKRYNKFKKIFITCIITGFVFFPITNFNPYITNLLEGKHILYPLKGEGAIDIITPFIPTDFKNKNRFEKFSISLFSKSGQIGNGKDILKFPFSVTKKELNRLADPDIGIAGFGIFYSGIIILTLILLLYYLIKEKFKLNKIQEYILYSIGILFISVFIIPEPWWFRYIPHFYLIPLLILLYIEFDNNIPTDYFRKRFINFILFIYFINIGLIVSAVVSINIYNTEKINYQLKQIKNKNKIIKVEYLNFPSNLTRLNEYNIQYNVGYFKENEKYIYLEPSKNQTKIEYFEYDPSLKINIILSFLDKLFSQYEADYKEKRD